VIAGSIGFAYRHALATPWYARAWQQSPAAIGNTICWRIAEIGESVQNVSADAFLSKVAVLPVESTAPSVMLTMELHAIRYVSGGLAIGLILMGICRLRRFSHTEAFLGAYVAILLIWPFTAVRFWAPVLPLLLGYGWIGLRSAAQSRPTLTKATACYCVVFCLFGSIAMIQTLRESFFDRGRQGRESRLWLNHHPRWLAAYERFGGERKP
jgi:small-conductance mechanosensitive channel